MIERHELPADPADWTGVDVKLPRLSDDSAKSCPLKLSDIWGYVKTEAGDLDRSDRRRFKFLRTAKIKSKRFWIWEYVESDGEIAYVLVRQEAGGGTELGLTSTMGLTPEQYILAAYYNEVDWS
jgi:hypothetical protein